MSLKLRVPAALPPAGTALLLSGTPEPPHFRLSCYWVRSTLANFLSNLTRDDYSRGGSPVTGRALFQSRPDNLPARVEGKEEEAGIGSWRIRRLNSYSPCLTLWFCSLWNINNLFDDICGPQAPAPGTSMLKRGLSGNWQACFLFFPLWLYSNLWQAQWKPFHCLGKFLLIWNLLSGHQTLQFPSTGLDLLTTEQHLTIGTPYWTHLHFPPSLLWGERNFQRRFYRNKHLQPYRAGRPCPCCALSSAPEESGLTKPSLGWFFRNLLEINVVTISNGEWNDEPCLCRFQH